MDNDDIPVGRILTRREVLTLFGAAGTAALIAACAPGQTGTAVPTVLSGVTPTTAAGTNPTAVATAVAANVTAVPSCVVRPSLTEGPYFVDEQLNRSDIRTEPSDNSVRAGIPLALAFHVSQIANNACTALPGAQVDVWHCDAEGEYSGVSDAGFQTEGEKWLRGYQITDTNGLAAFTTIYPGWYSGRTTHIHFKIRTPGLDNQEYEFTSQLFFDEDLTAKVYAVEPYAAKGQKDLANASDGIFSDQVMLDVSGDTTNGFNSVFQIALDLSDTEAGADDSAGGGGGGPGGPPPGGPRGTGTP